MCARRGGGEVRRCRPTGVQRSACACDGRQREMRGRGAWEREAGATSTLLGRPLGGVVMGTAAVVVVTDDGAGLVVEVRMRMTKSAGAPWPGRSCGCAALRCVRTRADVPSRCGPVAERPRVLRATVRTICCVDCPSSANTPVDLMAWSEARRGQERRSLRQRETAKEPASRFKRHPSAQLDARSGAVLHAATRPARLSPTSYTAHKTTAQYSTCQDVPARFGGHQFAWSTHINRLRGRHCLESL